MGEDWSGTIGLFVVFIPFLIWYVLSRSKGSAIALLVLTLILLIMHYSYTKYWEWYWHWSALVMLGCAVTAMLNFTKIKNKFQVAAINTGIYAFLVLYVGLYEMHAAEISLDKVDYSILSYSFNLYNKEWVRKGSYITKTCETAKTTTIKEIMPVYDNLRLDFVKIGKMRIPSDEHAITLKEFLQETISKVWEKYSSRNIYSEESIATFHIGAHYKPVQSTETE